MKKIRVLTTALLLLMLLLNGCGRAGSASGGDLQIPENTGTASEGDLWQTTRVQLLQSGGIWRSEQTEAADDAVVTRTLRLDVDGSFSYEENAETLSGSWALDGSQLVFTVNAAGETSAELRKARFDFSLDQGLLILTQNGSVGLIGDTEGQTLYFYQTQAPN